ncbi:MAG TPA: hypothetical protein VGE62_01110 [Candidatus Paceibacterota bacterium]
MITITINGIDRSDHIDVDSIIFTQGVSKQPSILAFTIKKNSSKTIPNLGQAVIMEEDGERLFKGTLTEKGESVIEGLVVGYSYAAKDGLHNFDRKLVKKAYNSTDAVSVAQDIVDSFSTGFTLEAPAVGPGVDSIRFNYEQPSKAMQALAGEIGWDWYIDPYDVVHFFPKKDKVAPFEITDTNGNLSWGSLEFDSNILELKNIVYVRGGEYLDAISESEAIDKYTADGYQLAWPLVYRYNGVQVTVDGVSKTVGIDNITDPLSVDVLYNFSEKSIRFREDNKPADEALVKIFGNAYIPLIVQASDSISISAYGEFEDIKIDKNINSIREAEMLAGAVLDQWSEGSYEGRFRTMQKGLRAGQYITINSAEFGVNDSFKINTVTGRMKGHDRMEYTISFLKSGETDFTDIMVGLLGKDRKNIVISDDEVIQRLIKIEETFGAGDEITEIVKTVGPYHYEDVAGGNTPGIYNFSTYS